MTKTFRLLVALSLLSVVAGCMTVPPVGPGDIVARVEVSGNDVRINGQRIGSGALLRPGDRVSTGPASSARIRFSDGTVVQLAENTDPDFDWTTRAVKSGEEVLNVAIDYGWMLIDTGSRLSARVFSDLADVFLQSRVIVEARRNRFHAYLLSGRLTPLRPSMRSLAPNLVLKVNRGRAPRVEQFDRRTARELRGIFDRYDFVRVAPRPPRRPPRQTQPPPQPPQEQYAVTPNLLGLTVAQAKRRLRIADLRLGRTSTARVAGEARPGTVTAQSPGPRRQVKKGSAVNLVLAPVQTRPQIERVVPIERVLPLQLVKVPNLRGRRVDDATRMLERMGLALGRVSGPSGGILVVVGQSPKADQQVVKGSRVDLEVQRVVQ